jgi:hypothetical protein
VIQIFHGNNKITHDGFQSWRQSNPDGFNLTEGPKGQFRMHWALDKRESSLGRGCGHQGGSGNEFGADKGGCYTTARKVCSNSAGELRDWAKANNAIVRSCSHCDTSRFPIPI